MFEMIVTIIMIALAISLKYILDWFLFKKDNNG